MAMRSSASSGGSDEWDLIVVDHAAERSALDFLDAPSGSAGSSPGG